MNRTSKVIIAVVVIAVVAVMMMTFLAGALLLMSRAGAFSEDKVGLIRVEGVITAGRGAPSVFGATEAGSERIVKLLEEFRKDDSVQSLVIRINSPGGSAAGSQEIYSEIMRARDAGKKITVSMGDVAASGGYYIASAADTIYADPATLTGSIGVILGTAEIHRLLDRFGIDLITIKSGEHKDIGSGSRPMTPEEREILQSIIDDVFDQFVTDVSVGRDMAKEDVLELADGRVYTGRQALELNLVDQNGCLQDAFAAAARDAGIEGEFSVVEYGRSSGFFDMLFGAMDVSPPSWLHHSRSLEEVARMMLRADPEMRLGR